MSKIAKEQRDIKKKEEEEGGEKKEPMRKEENTINEKLFVTNVNSFDSSWKKPLTNSFKFSCNPPERQRARPTGNRIKNKGDGASNAGFNRDRRRQTFKIKIIHAIAADGLTEMKRNSISGTACEISLKTAHVPVSGYVYRETS